MYYFTDSIPYLSIIITNQFTSLAVMSQQQPQLTLKSYILMDNSCNQYLRGQNTMQKLQFASLTKMYTLYSCLQLNTQLNIRPQLCWLHIMPSTEQGTQAELPLGKYLKLEDLYYGLMLPSGNDAALNLAYYYGYWMGMKERFRDYEWRGDKNVSLEGKRKYGKIYLARFVAYMNQVLVKEKLGHSDTHFENPHGLSDKLQRSTAWQLANATMFFLKNSKFSKIAQTAQYTAIHSDGQTQTWQNTNILLKDGYIGVKTGYTMTAGGCLCSRKFVYHNHSKKMYDFVLVVLGCKGQEERFSETQKIIGSFMRYLDLMKGIK